MDAFNTDRLIVRKMTTSDLHDYLAYRNHPESLRYMPIGPMDGEEAASFLERQASLNFEKDSGWISFALELKNEGHMIGEIGVYISPEPASLGDLGWSVNPDYQRRGYASEAAPLLLEYVFGMRCLHRVTAGCDAANAASVRIMERLGLRQEGHYRQSRRISGEWRDEYLYAMLREEWPTLR